MMNLNSVSQFKVSFVCTIKVDKNVCLKSEGEKHLFLLRVCHLKIIGFTCLKLTFQKMHPEIMNILPVSSLVTSLSPL